jgi:hypothetical protein
MAPKEVPPKRDDIKKMPPKELSIKREETKMHFKGYGTQLALSNLKTNLGIIGRLIKKINNNKTTTVSGFAVAKECVGKIQELAQENVMNVYLLDHSIDTSDLAPSAPTHKGGTETSATQSEGDKTPMLTEQDLAIL